MVKFELTFCLVENETEGQFIISLITTGNVSEGLRFPFSVRDPSLTRFDVVYLWPSQPDA
jgi:hypothetical protein